MFLFDFGCFLLILVVMVIIWRIYFLICDVRKYCLRFREERFWKIRKVICKNVVFLLVDILVILFCFIIFIIIVCFFKFVFKFI